MEMYRLLFLVLLTNSYGADHMWCMIVIDDYHRIIEVFILVINVIPIILCKGHVNTYDVIIIKISHVWTIVLKSFWPFDVICNPHYDWVVDVIMKSSM